MTESSSGKPPTSSKPRTHPDRGDAEMTEKQMEWHTAMPRCKKNKKAKEIVPPLFGAGAELLPPPPPAPELKAPKPQSPHANANKEMKGNTVSQPFVRAMHINRIPVKYIPNPVQPRAENPARADPLPPLDVNPVEPPPREPVAPVLNVIVMGEEQMDFHKVIGPSPPAPKTDYSLRDIPFMGHSPTELREMEKRLGRLNPYAYSMAALRSIHRPGKQPLIDIEKFGVMTTTTAIRSMMDTPGQTMSHIETHCTRNPIKAGEVCKASALLLFPLEHEHTSRYQTRIELLPLYYDLIQIVQLYTLALSMTQNRRMGEPSLHMVGRRGAFTPVLRLAQATITSVQPTVLILHTEKHRDKKGNILPYCEWSTVDKDRLADFVHHDSQIKYVIYAVTLHNMSLTATVSAPHRNFKSVWKAEDADIASLLFNQDDRNSCWYGSSLNKLMVDDVTQYTSMLSDQYNQTTPLGRLTSFMVLTETLLRINGTDHEMMTRKATCRAETLIKLFGLSPTAGFGGAIAGMCFDDSSLLIVNKLEDPCGLQRLQRDSMAYFAAARFDIYGFVMYANATNHHLRFSTKAWTAMAESPEGKVTLPLMEGIRQTCHLTPTQPFPCRSHSMADLRALSVGDKPAVRQALRDIYTAVAEIRNSPLSSRATNPEGDNVYYLSAYNQLALSNEVRQAARIDCRKIFLDLSTDSRQFIYDEAIIELFISSLLAGTTEKVLTQEEMKGIIDVHFGISRKSDSPLSPNPRSLLSAAGYQVEVTRRIFRRGNHPYIGARDCDWLNVTLSQPHTPIDGILGEYTSTGKWEGLNQSPEQLAAFTIHGEDNQRQAAADAEFIAGMQTNPIAQNSWSVEPMATASHATIKMHRDGMLELGRGTYDEFCKRFAPFHSSHTTRSLFGFDLAMAPASLANWCYYLAENREQRWLSAPNIQFYPHASSPIYATDRLQHMMIVMTHIEEELYHHLYELETERENPSPRPYTSFSRDMPAAQEMVALQWVRLLTEWALSVVYIFIEESFLFLANPVSRAFQTRRGWEWAKYMTQAKDEDRALLEPYLRLAITELNLNPALVTLDTKTTEACLYEQMMSPAAQPVISQCRARQRMRNITIKDMHTSMAMFNETATAIFATQKELETLDHTKQLLTGIENAPMVNANTSKVLLGRAATLRADLEEIYRQVGALSAIIDVGMSLAQKIEKTIRRTCNAAHRVDRNTNSLMLADDLLPTNTMIRAILLRHGSPLTNIGGNMLTEAPSKYLALVDISSMDVTVLFESLTEKYTPLTKGAVHLALILIGRVLQRGQVATIDAVRDMLHEHDIQARRNHEEANLVMELPMEMGNAKDQRAKTLERMVYEGTYMPTPLHTQTALQGDHRYVRILGSIQLNLTGVRTMVQQADMQRNWFKSTRSLSLDDRRIHATLLIGNKPTSDMITVTNPLETVAAEMITTIGGLLPSREANPSSLEGSFHEGTQTESASEITDMSFDDSLDTRPRSPIGNLTPADEKAEREMYEEAIAASLAEMTIPPTHAIPATANLPTSSGGAQNSHSRKARSTQQGNPTERAGKTTQAGQLSPQGERRRATTDALNQSESKRVKTSENTSVNPANYSNTAKPAGYIPQKAFPGSSSYVPPQEQERSYPCSPVYTPTQEEEIQTSSSLLTRVLQPKPQRVILPQQVMNTQAGRRPSGVLEANHKPRQYSSMVAPTSSAPPPTEDYNTTVAQSHGQYEDTYIRAVTDGQADLHACRDIDESRIRRYANAQQQDVYRQGYQFGLEQEMQRYPLKRIPNSEVARQKKSHARRLSQKNTPVKDAAFDALYNHPAFVALRAQQEKERDAFIADQRANQ